MADTALLEIGLSDQRLHALSSKRIFFGHQSVGDNIIQRLRDSLAADSRLGFRIVNSRNPETVSGPAFIDAYIGENANPQSKNSDFLAIVNRGFDGIAMFKYCYVDIGEATSVRQMFHDYEATIDAVRRQNPLVRIVHVTVPLTTVIPSPKAWLKSLLGRNTAQRDNIKRNLYNTLLREAYPKEPIFDLATLESTHANGSRSFFKYGGEHIYTLTSEYTDDGGHLNQTGSRLAAKLLIEVLANVR